MTKTSQRGRLVVIAAAGTLQRADVIRAVLAVEGIRAHILGEHTANTLSHILVGIHPRGVCVAVGAEEERRACKVLAERGLGQMEPQAPPAAEPEAPSPDEDARRACWAAVMSWFFPLLLPAAVYDLLMAAAAAGKGNCNVVDRRRYVRHVSITIVLCVPLIVGVAALILLSGMAILEWIVGPEGL